MGAISLRESRRQNIYNNNCIVFWLQRQTVMSYMYFLSECH